MITIHLSKKPEKIVLVYCPLVQNVMQNTLRGQIIRLVPRRGLTFQHPWWSPDPANDHGWQYVDGTLKS